MDTNIILLLTRVISRNQVAGAYLIYKSKYYKIKTSVIGTVDYLQMQKIAKVAKVDAGYIAILCSYLYILT